MVKSTLACGLQECLSKEWMGDNFSDFRVVVDGSEYFCHKFILSACSTFFKTLLGSDFREKKDECVELKNMSKETFDVIINAIYKGVDDLTKDNIISVWQATHMLHIPFLIEECERFVLENMSQDNYTTFYKTAVLLNSKCVISLAVGFMKENFEQFCKTETFLELSYPVLYSLVDDDTLNVNSEDLVLESIVNWVSYVNIKPGKIDAIDCKSCEAVTRSLSKSNSPKNCLLKVFPETNTQENYLDKLVVEKCFEDIEAEIKADNKSFHIKKELAERLSNNNSQTDTETSSSKVHRYSSVVYDRKKYLGDLLSTARIFLASRSYLEKLHSHQLIRDCVEALEIVHEALMYHWRSVSFPSNFVIPYRNSSGKRNVMAFVKYTKLHLFELNSGATYETDLPGTCLNTDHFNNLASYGSSLCFIHGGKYNSKCEHKHKKEKFCSRRYVVTCDGNKEISTVCEVCQYCKLELVSLNGVFVRIINSTCTKLNSDQNIFGGFQFMYRSSYESLCAFQENILLFSKCKVNSKPSVNVHCYNIYTKSTQDINFEGPADHIVSFSSGAKKTFILQKNGALRSVNITYDSKIEFTFVTQLWNSFDFVLDSAVYFKNELILFCTEKPDNIDTFLVKFVPGVFKMIKVVEVDSDSNLVPLVVPETWLVAKQKKY
ncbi:uncharacterized protein LOC131940459 [Physella acuta]|uniref:uncharacterized protein LOC131940459 n=1 Tax=Physella acuta TaxID=109671 RepID=UPI0027DCEDFA|nr:uncharacterized protein LOC131940459 [Physella acuta]